MLVLPSLRSFYAEVSCGQRPLTNREILMAELNRLFSERDMDVWLAKLTKAGLPCGRINSIPEVFAHPQAQAREMTLETEHASAGIVRVPGFPYKFSHTPAEIQRPPPMLGEHTEEVLTGILGYSIEDVASLRDKRATKFNGILQNVYTENTHIEIMQKVSVYI